MATLSPPSADALRAHAAGAGGRASSPRSRARCRTTRARWRAASARPCASASQVALNRFVDLLVGEASREPRATPTGGSARASTAQGRTLDALLAAYRVGARLAWRRFVDAGTQAGFPADALYDLGEAMFAYIDEISAESAAGFAEAQSEAAGETQRRRRRLLRLLVQEPAADAEAVRTAAQAAGWALPRLLAAVVAGEADQPEGLAAARGEAGPSEELVDGIAARLARRLGPGAVGAAVGGLAVVMMPDPEGPGRRKALEAALGGERRGARPRGAVAGGGREPAPRRGGVPAGRAGSPRARGAAAMAAAGRRPPRAASLRPHARPVSRRLVVADEHLPALLLAAAPGDRRRPRAHAAGAAGRPRRGPARTARGHAARLAGPARAGAGDRRRARRPPADGALPAQAAARAVRRAPGGSGRALRALARPSRRRRRSL